MTFLWTLTLILHASIGQPAYIPVQQFVTLDECALSARLNAQRNPNKADKYECSPYRVDPDFYQCFKAGKCTP